MVISEQPKAPASDAFKTLSDAVSGLLRQEVRRGEAEMKEKVRLGSKGAGLLAAAGLCSGAAAGTAALSLVRLLDRVAGPRVSALVITACLSAAAAVLASRGVRELRPALPLLPTDTLGSLADDLRASEINSSNGAA